MWRFDWGVFWPILIIVLSIAGYLSQQLEAINRCLLDIEQRLKEIRSSALFLDAEARKQQAVLNSTFEEWSAKDPLVPYPMENMRDLERDILPVRPPEGMWKMQEQLQSIAKILETLRSK
jgi:hypothetical protein